MPTHAVIVLLLWAVAINAGLLLLLMWRRGLRGRVGYALLLAADFMMAGVLLAGGWRDHPLAIVAIGAFFFLVIVPMILRAITAWALKRGRWDLAQRLTGIREMLQPGAGVGRERDMLKVLRELQTGDTGDVLERMQVRAANETDPQIQGVLHEQCLTLLVIERRWEDAARYAKEHVTPHLVADRPRLGAALIRLYGELGDVESLVRTMYLIEGGSAVQDPEAADVLQHCRLMVLAFTGHAAVLETLLAPGQRSFLEPKIRLFWMAVAYQHSGDVAAAKSHFAHALKALAASDEKARMTITERLHLLEEGASPVTLPDPEQTQRLVLAIRERLALTLARPRMQARDWRQTPVTALVIVVNLVVYAALELWGNGSKDSHTLIQAGASLTLAVEAGEYWRLISAMFLHAGLWHLVLNTLMLWFLGRFAEQLVGSLKLAIVYLAAGLVGNLASLYWRTGPISVGASSSIFGILGASLVVLLLSRGRLPEAWRRSMVIVMTVVIGLSFLPAINVKIIDNYAHLGGLVGGMAAGGLLFVSTVSRWDWLRRLDGPITSVLGTCGVALLVYCGWGLVTSDVERLPWAESHRAGLSVRHPVTWTRHPKGQAGWLELADLRTGDWVGFGRAPVTAPTTLKALVEYEVTLLKRSRALFPRGANVFFKRTPEGTLAKGWAGVRLDIQPASGRQFVELRVYFLLGAKPPQEVIQGRLQTNRARFERARAVFKKMLGTVGMVTAR